MNIQNIYNKKSNSYDNYRNNKSGFNEIKNILNNFLINRNNNNLDLLDVGCGTGHLLNYMNQYNFKTINGIDPSESMINKSLENTKNIMNCKVWVDYIENIKDNSYDIIICNQVIQNLTLNIEEAFNLRQNFYNQLYRVLKKNGLLIITTRNIKNTYSNMYWFCDKILLEKSINDMNHFVPKNFLKEVKLINKFNLIKKRISEDLIYKKEYYYDYNLINDVEWRNADSFWTHVFRNNEFDKFNKYINELIKKNKIEEYIQNNNLLRNEEGHITILECYK